MMATGLEHTDSDDDFKYFISYLHDDDVIRPLCNILPEMSGHIKYFDNGGKNMSLKMKMKVCILNTLRFGIKLENF